MGLAVESSPRWGSLRAACAIMGRQANTYRVLRLALLGQIRHRAQPGRPIEFRLDDAERLVAERQAVAS